MNHSDIEVFQVLYVIEVPPNVQDFVVTLTADGPIDIFMINVLTNNCLIGNSDSCVYSTAIEGMLDGMNVSYSGIITEGQQKVSIDITAGYPIEVQLRSERDDISGQIECNTFP